MIHANPCNIQVAQRAASPQGCQSLGITRRVKSAKRRRKKGHKPERARDHAGMASKKCHVVWNLSKGGRNIIDARTRCPRITTRLHPCASVQTVTSVDNSLGQDFETTFAAEPSQRVPGQRKHTNKTRQQLSPYLGRQYAKLDVHRLFAHSVLLARISYSQEKVCCNMHSSGSYWKSFHSFSQAKRDHARLHRLPKKKETKKKKKKRNSPTRITICMGNMISASFDLSLLTSPTCS